MSSAKKINILDSKNYRLLLVTSLDVVAFRKVSRDFLCYALELDSDFTQYFKNKRSAVALNGAQV